MILYGDNLMEIKKISNESIDMIYLDPPFFTQKLLKSTELENGEFYSFDDKWSSIQEYIEFLRIRLKEFYRVLKTTGSIFFHCDRNASHHIRVLLDEIFGDDNFRSEIIWNYKRWSNSKKGLLNSHQTIYFYSKSNSFKFNTMHTDYSPTTNVDQILQERIRNKNGKCVYKRDKNGIETIKVNKKGVPLSDVWDIPFLNPKAKERTGYPTQKPVLLLERIINISTDVGDTVLDPFCGSGSTLVAAKILGRNYIGIDNLQKAVNLTQTRLDNPIKTSSSLLENGVESYLCKTEKEMLILKCLNAIPVQRNKGIDGILDVSYKDAPVAIKIQKQNETIIEAKTKLLEAAAKKQCRMAVLVLTQGNLEDTVSPRINDKIDLIMLKSYELILQDVI